MANTQILSGAELHSALQELQDWSVKGRTIVADFRFKTFRHAIAFIVEVAFEAEELNHHPDLRNAYNRVSFSLCTHDAGDAVTERDVALAKRISAVALRFQGLA
jgi:4a-hydroxytetrahydrobiopterin dehydratase